MRKLISFFLVLVLLLSVSVAVSEDFDMSSMTDEQLHKILDSVRNELTKRELVFGEKTVIFDQDGVQVYLTGDCSVGKRYTELYAVVVNNSDVPVRFETSPDYTITVNGWDTWGDPDYLRTTSPGKKQKGYINFNSENAEITSFDQIEDIEITLVLKNADTRKVISTGKTVIIHFNNQ